MLPRGWTLTLSDRPGADPSNPVLWKELEGDGAIHTLPNPTPGTLYARAATRGRTAKSGFTTPVSIVLK